MVYIYKKIVGSKDYYYLRLSERKGKKVISKDIAYLGNSLDEVKKNLEKFPKYKDEIRKSYKKIHNFIEPNYYLEKVKKLKLKKDVFLKDKLDGVESCKIHFNEHFKKLDNLTQKEILKNFVVEFSFNTTSIEGNTINLEEARNLLENGLTPKDKSLREIYDLQNTEKVFFDIYNSNKEINHEFIINIHKGLVVNIDLRVGYRTTDIRVIKSNFDATPAPYVKIDMDLLSNWYNKNKGKLHPLVLATMFHHKFERIHPFMDGNGRTGRILFAYILLRNNYPPIIIHKKARKEYLEALRKADKSGLKDVNLENYFDLVQFCADELVEGYWDLFL
jgi:Fic family protein